MLLNVFPSGPFKTNTIVIACATSKKCAIVDPAKGSYDCVVSFIEDKKLLPQNILITHGHWDHIGDAARLKQMYSLQLAVHHEDADSLLYPEEAGMIGYKKVEAVEPDILLHDGDMIELGKLTIDVIHTPGHTPGGVCYYIADEGILLSGDTIFKGTIGKLTFSTGQPERMWPSLKKLAKLPSNTLVYPGHSRSFILEEDYWLDNAKEHFGG